MTRLLLTQKGDDDSKSSAREEKWRGRGQLVGSLRDAASEIVDDDIGEMALGSGVQALVRCIQLTSN